LYAKVAFAANKINRHAGATLWCGRDACSNAGIPSLL
jgi:hypothetical protein